MKQLILIISMLVLFGLYVISISVSDGTSKDLNNKIENVNEKVNHIINNYQECAECGCLVNKRCIKDHYVIEETSRTHHIIGDRNTIEWVETHCENLVKKEVCRNCYKRLNKAE